VERGVGAANLALDAGCFRARQRGRHQGLDGYRTGIVDRRQGAPGRAGPVVEHGLRLLDRPRRGHAFERIDRRGLGQVPRALERRGQGRVGERFPLQALGAVRVRPAPLGGQDLTPDLRCTVTGTAGCSSPRASVAFAGSPTVTTRVVCSTASPAWKRSA